MSDNQASQNKVLLELPQNVRHFIQILTQNQVPPQAPPQSSITPQAAQNHGAKGWGGKGMGKGKSGRGGNYGGDYHTQSHGRGSSYSTAYGTCVNDDGTPLPAKYNAKATESAESMSLWARDNPFYLCLFKGHTSRRHPKFQNDNSARAAHNKSAWGIATRIINTGGTWKQFAAAMGLDPELPCQNKWDVASMTTYDLIIGLMEYSGGFA